MFVFLATLTIYSFFLYAISFISILGMHFNHYYTTFLFLGISVITVYVSSHFYYHFYDRIKVLRFKLTKYITAFLIAYLVVHYSSVGFDGSNVHLIVKVFFSLCLSFLFHDDPISIRSVKRTLK
jgi:hypothetical protein